MNGSSIMPILELNQEEEKALKKKRARLDRTEAVLAYIGSLLWFAFSVFCVGVFGLIGFIIGCLLKDNKVFMYLFVCEYVICVFAPCMALVDELLEHIDLKFTCWWREFCNRRIEGLKFEYHMKKVEAMDIEIDKAFD